MTSRTPIIHALALLAAGSPAWAQDALPAQPERVWEIVRRSEAVTGAGDTAWQNAADAVVRYRLAPDPQDPQRSLLTATPVATAVAASGQGRAAVGYDPSSAVALTIDHRDGSVSRADGQPSTALDAINQAARHADKAAATPGAAAGEGAGASEGEGDNNRDQSERERTFTVALAGLGPNIPPVSLTQQSRAVVVDGQQVAEVSSFQSAPVSFTTAAGDTVLLRSQGFSATDPSGAVVLASGQSAGGQVLTAAGDLVPFSTQTSSRSSGPGDGLSPAARAALDLLLPAPASITRGGFAPTGPGGDATPPAWLSAITAATQALGAAGGATPAGAGAAATDLVAAGLANQSNAAALAAAFPASNLSPAANPLAGRPANTANPLGPGARLLPAPGGSGNAADTPLSQALAGLLPAAAAGGEPPSGLTADAAAGLNNALASAGLAATPANAGSAADRAPGSAAGSSLLTALGGAAVYGINPVTGAAGSLPDLTSEVFISNRGQELTAITGMANAGFMPATLPPSSGGFTSVALPEGFFSFSVFDSGGADNEDVQTIRLTNNGVPVPLTAADGVGDGTNTTLFFLTDGSMTTFDAATNPAVASNRFSASLMSGTAVLSLESISSGVGPNTGAVAITSPIESGMPLQEFELREVPSSPPDPGLDFANLGISVSVAP